MNIAEHSSIPPLNVKILKYVKRHDGSNTPEAMACKFGSDTAQRLGELEKNKLIVESAYEGNGNSPRRYNWKLTSMGRDVLQKLNEDKRERLFYEAIVPLITAILGGVVGSVITLFVTAC